MGSPARTLHSSMAPVIRSTSQSSASLSGPKAAKNISRDVRRRRSSGMSMLQGRPPHPDAPGLAFQRGDMEKSERRDDGISVLHEAQESLFARDGRGVR